MLPGDLSPLFSFFHNLDIVRGKVKKIMGNIAKKHIARSEDGSKLLKYIAEDKESIRGLCERCRAEITVPKSNANPIADGFDLRDTIKCKCGNIHNLIAGNVKTQKWAKEEIKFDPDYVPPSKNNRTAACPLCRSTQLFAGNKGFSLGTALAGGILFGPFGLLGGFWGSERVIVTCLACGHKWEAGK